MGDWSVIRSVVIGMAGLGVSLGLFAVAAPYAVPALIVLALISVLASVLVINLQLRLMQVAGTAQTLAAASNHAALNLANALGAWVGGVVIAAGYGYTAPSIVGVGLAALGLGILGISLLVHRRDHPERATLRPVGAARPRDRRLRGRRTGLRDVTARSAPRRRTGRTVRRLAACRAPSRAGSRAASPRSASTVPTSSTR